MALKVIGLDLGSRSVKAVLLEASLRGFSVADSCTVPLPGNGDAGPLPLVAGQASAVRALVAERGWRFDTAVVAFPGFGASSSTVQLPFTDQKRIEQTIGFEVEGQIPFDLSEVAWDWQPLSVREGRSDLLVAVVRKEEMVALLGALAGVGVDPRAVLPPGPAYASLFQAGAVAPFPPPADGSQAGAEAIVDVGRERTSFCVVSGGSCEAARTVAFGGGHLARALARELSVTEEQGEALLAASLGAPLPEDLAAKASDPLATDTLRRALVPLVRELRATLRAWRARAGQRPLARLLLAGEAGRLPAVAEVIAPEVDGKVEPLTFAGAAGEKIAPADAPGLALALALALRGQLGSRGQRLNLRRGDLAYTRDFEHLKGKVARLAAYAALVVLLAIASAGVKAFAVARQEAALDRALCDAEQKIVGRCYTSFEEAQAVLRGRGGGGATLPRVSAVDVLAELAYKAPPEVPMRLERIEITKEKLHLQGTTGAAESVDRIATALKASRCFADARSGGARRRSIDGKFEFSVDSTVTCLDSGRGAAGEKGR